MPVSERMREIEAEIDQHIALLNVWKTSKWHLLEHLMERYRDAVELLLTRLIWAETFNNLAEHLPEVFVFENKFRTGMLWCTKWATEYCDENGTVDIPLEEDLVELLDLGSAYQTLVDALKQAQHNVLEFQIDENQRIISVYEGSQAIPYERRIIEQGIISSSLTLQFPLTMDSDQVTSRWKAGDYRMLVRRISDHAAGLENRILVDPDFLKKVGKTELSAPQPTIVWIERPSSSPEQQVFDDLVFPNVMNSQLKWKLVSFLENPILKIRERYCTMSSDIKALSISDDYMLRLAARIDQDQYRRASLLREDRMIELCEHTFNKASPSWRVETRVRFDKPPGEIDVLATRDESRLLLELKSTLRPETPWEVFKRNEDILNGVRQAKSLIDRGVAQYGYVITDRYRGDYHCWEEALKQSIQIGTLYDLETIANDPMHAPEKLRALVGIVNGSDGSPEPLPDREFNLAGWKFRLIDGESPAS